jgi:hypothetical protein
MYRREENQEAGLMRCLRSNKFRIKSLQHEEKFFLSRFVHEPVLSFSVGRP